MIMNDRNILGIDFGTTNSKIAYMLLDEPVIIENSEGKKMTPSVVYFKNENDVVVGEIAKHNLIVNPNHTLSSIKKEMGGEFRKQIGRYKFPPEYIACLLYTSDAADEEDRVDLGGR